jgi:ADP-ribosylglycohydrolase
MIGAIAGDIIGSSHEWNPEKTTDFELFTSESRFTDDSVLTIAVAAAILESRQSNSAPDYRRHIIELARGYPHAGYGGSFRKWFASDDPQPYGSWGNGSAMRVSPVGWAFDDIDEVLLQAGRSAAVSHDHPEGIKGAQAVALCVFLARSFSSRDEIRHEVTSRFGYDLTRTVDEIRPSYSFDVSCQGSVPEAIIAFLDADDYEGAVRNAVSLGGDADTQACIAGGIAEAMWGVPEVIIEQAMQRVPKDLAEIVDSFRASINQ